MSGSENSPLDPNTTSEGDSFEPEEWEEIPEPASEDQDRPKSWQPDPPLPDFTTEVLESTEIPAPGSSVGSQSSEELPPAPGDEATFEARKPASAVNYRVSSAEPDLPGHILPPEESQPEDEESPSTWQTVWAITREVGETIILTLVIFFLIQLVIRNFRVVGTSMVNNLHDGQYLIIDKVTYNPIIMNTLGFGGPERGDVIVFKPPRNPGDDYVKRVIGLPGEKIQVIKGQVLINDQPLEEPFSPLPGSYSMPAPVIVPDDQVFVLGDNRNNSNDSHNWGPLPIDNIVGRAWLSYWPPDQWGAIPRDAPTDEATLRSYFNQLIPNANAQNEQ